MVNAHSAKATIFQALFEGMLLIWTFLLRSKRMVHTVSLQHHFKVVGSKYCGSGTLVQKWMLAIN